MLLRSVFKVFTKPLRAFMRNERANMTVILGLSILPLMMCAGVAVDYERAINARSQLQAAIDTATLYAAAYSSSNAGTSTAALTALAQPYLTQNYQDGGDAKVTNFSVTDTGTSVVTTATIQLNTPFMALGGYTTMNLTQNSTVLKSGINLEVSLVLDNTNSMNSTNAQTGNSAIYDLKAAATKFVNTVMPATQGSFYTKIAVVPYNNSVNMGTSAMAAAARGNVPSGTSTSPGKTNFTFSTNSQISASMAQSYFGQSCNNSGNSVCQRTLSISNCVTERTGADSIAYSDQSMASFPVGYAYLPSGNPCSVTPIVPLSTSATVLNTAIATMVAANSTSGQVGIAWGWYTLSPNVGIWSGSSVPSSYANLTTTTVANKVRKVMILMTDGEYNSASCNGVITGNDTVAGSAGYPYYNTVVGSGSPADHINCGTSSMSSNIFKGDSYTQSTAMCSAIKNSGVEIYVITFQLDSSYQNRVNLVNNCASDASHVIDADSTSLDAAFSSLANKILAMRIAS